jgi:putative glutamine amidotransferase
MRRPLIAVSAAIEVLDTPFGPWDCTKLGTFYTEAVYAAGGQPVVMPVTDVPPAGLMAGLDGLMLSGGGDLDPTLYGEQPDPTVYGVRPDRDAFEIALYEDAVERGLPILAICRGMQLINLLRGGNLIQEIEPAQSHWQTRPSSEASHSVDVVPGSRLAGVLGAESAQVNSYHHQGLARLGMGLEVTARCGSVIEAVEATDGDLVAIQWHPEHLAPVDPVQHAIFTDFVARAAERHTHQTQEETLCPTP